LQAFAFKFNLCRYTTGVTAMSNNEETYLGKHYKTNLEVCRKTPSNKAGLCTS
jgi:hypothetical protein